MNSIWFPDRRLTEPRAFISDSVQEDFEKQAALYTRLALNYTQLTAGNFTGRLHTAHLGDVTIYIEHLNQAIEAEITTTPTDLTIFIPLDESPSSAAFGLVGSLDSVHVMPPGGEFVVIAPPDSLFVLFAINRQALLNNAGLIPEVAEWLLALGPQGAIIRSAQLAGRLRMDLPSALESAVNSETPGKRTIIDQAVLFSIATALTMEWLRTRNQPVLRRTQTYERFHHAKHLLLNDVDIFSGHHKERFAHLGSRRSIEQAFNDHVFMGPLAYARLVRLHNARRKLLAAERGNETIGDIAAQEGFWDPSRFAAHYRKQFGELPSATRQRSA